MGIGRGASTVGSSLVCTWFIHCVVLLELKCPLNPRSVYVKYCCCRAIQVQQERCQYWYYYIARGSRQPSMHAVRDFCGGGFDSSHPFLYIYPTSICGYPTYTGVRILFRSKESFLCRAAHGSLLPRSSRGHRAALRAAHYCCAPRAVD